jgi:DNA-binding NtrC family response regulator
MRHPFPGNVRELRNLVERLVILTPGDAITTADVREVLPSGGARAGSGYYRPGTPLRELLDEIERELIQRALDHHDGHVTHTAADLGLERSHLYKKMRALGLRKGEDE